MVRAIRSLLVCLVVPLGACAVSPASSTKTASPASAPWHECARDDVAMPCTAEDSATTLVIRWRDGVVHRIDQYEERWQHELFIQGNSRYTNVRTGASLFVPLRPQRGTHQARPETEARRE